MSYTSEVGEWVERAGQLQAAGPYAAGHSEIIAVHAGLFPQAEPVCPTCIRKIGAAYLAIMRYLRQQAASNPKTSATTATPTTMQVNQARFLDDIIYTPHGLGVAYSNANLTDAIARRILARDPDAKRFFAVLPAEEPSVVPTSTLADVVQTAVHLPGFFATPAPEAEAAESQLPQLAEEKKMRLSRASKEQLQAYYEDELGQPAPEDATNDELRQALAAHRAAHATDSAE